MYESNVTIEICFNPKEESFYLRIKDDKNDELQKISNSFAARLSNKFQIAITIE